MTTSRDDPSRSSNRPLYCCFGCRFAAAIAQETGETAQTRWQLTRLGLAIFFTMNVMVFTLVLWTQDIYEPELDEVATASLLHELFRYLAMMFALPVLLLLGGPLLDSAWVDLRRRVFSTDLLLLLGVAASYAYSVASVLQGEGHVYFEVGCMVLVAVTLGRWLEATGKVKTTEALRSLEKLVPDRIRLIREGVEQSVSPASASVGDIIRVLPGERIPVDGEVVRNVAAIDQQVVTGESQPVVKRPGDVVYSGTLNLDGDIHIQARTPAGRGALQRLIDNVVAAASEKDGYGRLADRVASFFLPTVVTIAGVSLVGHALSGDGTGALMSSLAVILIACPCALALATPMAIWAALGRASRAGILFRNGDVLSRLAVSRTICFDKTGTLTTGKASVARFVDDRASDRNHTLSVARALAESSPHTLALAIASFSDFTRVAAPIVGARTQAGRGVLGTLQPGGTTVYLGSDRWMADVGQHMSGTLRDAAAEARRQRAAVVCVAWGGLVRGLFVLRETLRPEAAQVIAGFRESAYRQVLLTGDHAEPAERLARCLQIDFRAGLLPEEKAKFIQAIRRENGPVVMVGDGMNDAAALASADVGVAMACGADISRETADMCLLSSDLSRIPVAVEIAQKTVHTIRWNLIWSLVYNIVGIGLAAIGWLNPIVAAIAMVASSFLVVSNSLQLGYGSAPPQPPTHSDRHGPPRPTRRSEDSETVLATASLHASGSAGGIH